MGTTEAPSYAYANTFMGWFEDVFVYTHYPSLLVWKKFFQYLNNCFPSIKFETDQSTSHIHFLDVTVSIDDHHNIQTDLYTKPTDSHNYLNYKSAHPRHCRAGIPYSQFLRLKRICSTEMTFIIRPPSTFCIRNVASYIEVVVRAIYSNLVKYHLMTISFNLLAS